MESLSAYARQFLERIEKPDADLIDGIAPAVAIKQKNSTRNPRSTVATATEIYDYLRLLYARVGRTFCAKCGQEVKRDTVDEVAQTILALGDGTRLQVLFPLESGATTPDATPGKGGVKRKSVKKSAAEVTPRSVTQLSDSLKERLFELRKRGFNRLYQNGQIFEFSTPESLLDLNLQNQYLFWSIDLLSRPIRGRASWTVSKSPIAKRERSFLRRRQVTNWQRGACVSASVLNARTTEHVMSSQNPGCFHSTILTARVRAARVLETPSTSTLIS